MPRFACLTLAVLTTLAACASPEVRVAAPQPTSVERIAIRYPSVEVREVSLPSYAAVEDIFLRAPDGQLSSTPDLLWADDPTRAITLGLTRALAEVTGADVAPEPWPFDSFPSARVDVRIEDFIADTTGLVQLTGQAFIAPLDGRGQDRVLLIDLSRTAPQPADAAAIAAARSALVADLAVLIARSGLR